MNLCRPFCTLPSSLPWLDLSAWLYRFCWFPARPPSYITVHCTVERRQHSHEPLHCRIFAPPQLLQHPAAAPCLGASDCAPLRQHGGGDVRVSERDAGRRGSACVAWDSSSRRHVYYSRYDDIHIVQGLGVIVCIYVKVQCTFSYSYTYTYTYIHVCIRSQYFFGMHM